VAQNTRYQGSDRFRDSSSDYERRTVGTPCAPEYSTVVGEMENRRSVKRIESRSITFLDPKKIEKCFPNGKMGSSGVVVLASELICGGGHTHHPGY
jgi:hypothetical protein